MRGFPMKQGQANSSSLIFHVCVNERGFLYTPADGVQARILAPDGTEHRAFAEVTTCPVAGMYVLDEDGDTWSVPVAAATGIWTVEWKYKGADGETVTARTYFDVVSSDWPGNTSYRRILSPNVVRAEGVTTGMLDDVRLASLMDAAERYIERRTEQFFRPVFLSFSPIAHDSDAIFFSMPIIGVSKFYMNHSMWASNESAIEINFSPIDEPNPRHVAPDPRANPWIRIAASTNIFTGLSSLSHVRPPRLRSTAKANRVAGVFGYLERDGSVPELIVNAALRLVLAHARKLRPGAGFGPAGPIKSETTDRHSISFATDGSASASATWAFSRSPEVDEIIALHKRPIAIGVSASTWPLPL